MRCTAQLRDMAGVSMVSTMEMDGVDSADSMAAFTNEQAVVLAELEWSPPTPINSNGCWRPLYSRAVRLSQPSRNGWCT